VPWDQRFLRNLTVRGGVAPVRRYLPKLWPLLEDSRIDPSPVLTHDLSLAEAADGCDISRAP
jgi:threonine dehydrogenase-like Zn-dependent dehydrogenase